MSKVLIVGDSNALGEWGTIIPGPGVANNNDPEVFRPWNKEKYLEGDFPKPFQVVWPGFGYHLDKAGHCTVNYAFGGAGNFEAIFKVEEALGLAPCFTSPVFYNPDLIIWMLTEPCRDLKRSLWPDEAGLYDLEKYYKQSEPFVAGAKTIKEINDSLLKVALDGAQKIYKETHIPWLVIEGWGKLPEDISQYSFIKYAHRNWMDKIIGRPVPLISSWGTAENVRRRRPDLTESAADSLRMFKRQRPDLDIPDIPEGPDSEFKKIVEDYEAVIDIMNKSEKFPDNCHADRHIQKELAEELEIYV